MLVEEYRNVRALHLRSKVRLRAVHDHQIRLQGDDALDVGIDQAADLGTLQRFGWIDIEIADAYHARSRAHGEQHLGDRRHNRNDALRESLGVDSPAEAFQGPAKAGHYVLLRVTVPCAVRSVRL